MDCVVMMIVGRCRHGICSAHWDFIRIDPVSGNYVLGAPQIPQATIHLLNGKFFTVKAQNYSSTNKYVKSVMLNGNLITNTISHTQIMDGGTLVFEMTDTPLKHN